MNEDFRIKTGFFRHHKTRMLHHQLGADGVLSLLRLWAYAAEVRPDGSLKGMTGDHIELIAEWPGQKGAFIEAIRRSFLDGEDEFTLHDWNEHNPWAAEYPDRSAQGLLAKLAQVNPDAYQQLKDQGCTGISKEQYQHFKRNRNTTTEATSADPTANSQGQPGVSPGHPQGTPGQTHTAPAPAPSPTPTPIVSAKKKESINADTDPPEREDQCKTTPGTYLHSAQNPSPSAEAAEPDADFYLRPARAGLRSPPVFLSIPTRDNGKDYRVTQQQVDEWQDAYPALDVPQVLKAIRAWNIANPNRRKTTAGMPRHITNWLASEQKKHSPQDQNEDPYKDMPDCYRYPLEVQRAKLEEIARKHNEAWERQQSRTSSQAPISTGSGESSPGGMSGQQPGATD